MYMLIAPMDQVFIALSFLVLPALAARYASKKLEGFLSLWRGYVLAAVSATALFALAARIAGRPLMHLLYAGKFDDLTPMLYLLAFLPLFMGIGNTMNDALKAGERPELVFYAYVCSGAATLLGGIPLVIHFGLQGAIYGLLLSAATYTGALAVGLFSAICGRRTEVVGTAQKP